MQDPRIPSLIHSSRCAKERCIFLLQELKQRLIVEDKTLDMYGFPTPVGNTSELDKERLLYDAADQLQFYKHLPETTPNNLDQKNVFNMCMDSIQNVFSLQVQVVLEKLL